MTHEVYISLYEKKFSLVVKDALLPKEQRRLEKKFEKPLEIIGNFQRLNFKRQRLVEILGLQRDIKTKEEVLSTSLKLEDIEEQISTSLPLMKKASEEVEILLKEKFEMLIQVDDGMFEYIKENEITYQEVSKVISEAIQESKEKK